MKNNSNYSTLDLILKDSFLDDFLFNELNKSIILQKWEPKENIYLTTGKHVWFSSTVFDPIKTIIKENIEKKFNVKIKKIIGEFNYTMVLNTKESYPHTDGVDSNDKDFNTQFILYIKGNNELTNGTGFYTKKNDNYHLTTHIGFVENRALLFKNKVMHSPLKFISQDNTPRFSIIGFLSI